MRVKILEAQFLPGRSLPRTVRVLKVGGQSSAGVERWNLSCRRQNGRA